MLLLDVGGNPCALYFLPTCCRCTPLSFSRLNLEDLVDQALKGGTSIFESKGHHLVAIDSPTSSESSLIFVWWVYLNLAVSKLGVYEAEEIMAHHFFY